MAEQTLFPRALKGWAIFNPKTGLWSKGGTGPEWRKSPKIWANMGHLKNHLNLFIHTHYANRYRSARLDPPGHGGDVSHFVISRIYDGCIVVDVTTGEEYGANWINNHFFDYIRRQKSSRSYLKDRPAKFEGANEWLNLEERLDNECNCDNCGCSET